MGPAPLLLLNCCCVALLCVRIAVQHGAHLFLFSYLILSLPLRTVSEQR